MDINIHIEKKHLWTLTLLLTISMVIGFSNNIPWHPLQQITGDYGATSVDTDNDGIIDKANASQSCDADSVCEATNMNITGNLTIGTGTTFINSTHVIADNLQGNGSGLTSITASTVAWTGITGMPAGFSDGTDNTAGCTYLGSATGGGYAILTPPSSCLSAPGPGCRVMLYANGALTTTDYFEYSGNTWVTSGGTSGTNGDIFNQGIVTYTSSFVSDDVNGIETIASYWTLYCNTATCYVSVC